MIELNESFVDGRNILLQGSLSILFVFIAILKEFVFSKQIEGPERNGGKLHWRKRKVRKIDRFVFRKFLPLPKQFQPCLHTNRDISLVRFVSLTFKLGDLET